MISLKNKVVVVTGSSRGIGAEISKLFAANEARVVLTARNLTRLKKVASLLKTDEPDFLIVQADITQKRGMRKIVSNTIKKFGRIDIFVNNAGIGMKGDITNLSEKQYDMIFNTNLKSVYFSFLELIPLMKKQGGGQIINISSGAGRMGIPQIAAYSASKAALNAFSEAVAGEVRNDNIKISVLAPASTDTKFMSRMSRRSRTPSKASMKLTVNEVAEAVIFLAKQNQNAWTSMADIRPLLIKR